MTQDSLGGLGACLGLSKEKNFGSGHGSPICFSKLI